MKIIITESQYKNLINTQLDELMMSHHASVRLNNRFFNSDKKFLTVTIGKGSREGVNYIDVGMLPKTDEMIQEVKKRIDFILKYNINKHKNLGIILYKFEYDLSDIIWNEGWNSSKVINYMFKNKYNMYLSDESLGDEVTNHTRSIGDSLYAVVRDNIITTIFIVKSEQYKSEKEVIKNPYDIVSYSTESKGYLSEELLLSDYLIKGIHI